MYIFEDASDLMRHIERCAERADHQAEDKTNLKREQQTARARAGAFRECLEYLKDYFAAHPTN